MTKVTSDFGAQVKELRERLHLTQEAMAETLGVSFATVNRWKTDGRHHRSWLCVRSNCCARNAGLLLLTQTKDRRVEAVPSNSD